jgi:hypothetical protein
VGSIKTLTLCAITYLISDSFTKNPSNNRSINFISVHEDQHAFLRECQAYLVEYLSERKMFSSRSSGQKFKSARPSLFCDVARRRFVAGYRRFGTTYPFTFKGQAVQEDFLQGPSSPRRFSSRAKQPKKDFSWTRPLKNSSWTAWPVNFFDSLTLDDRTDRLSRNIVNQQSTYATQHPRRVKASTKPWRKRETSQMKSTFYAQYTFLSVGVTVSHTVIHESAWTHRNS